MVPSSQLARQDDLAPAALAQSLAAKGRERQISDLEQAASSSFIRFISEKLSPNPGALLTLQKVALEDCGRLKLADTDWFGGSYGKSGAGLVGG
jgi:hypothetical protein